MGERNLSITIEAENANGFPIEGSLRVDLFMNKENTKPDFSNSTTISGKTIVNFKLPRQIEIGPAVNYKEVKINVVVEETSTSEC